AAHGLGELQPALETLVEMACLTHDIGNPPFGHFGEFVIGYWFECHLDARFAEAVPQADEALRERLATDLKHFEGNAQAIRLVTRLLRLNLTWSQLAAMLKYVRPAYRPRPPAGNPGAYLAKKPGYYLSEEPLIEQLWQALEMPPGSRHPAAYIMEAADDIAYCLADIEDSVEKGILDIDTLQQLLVETFARLAGEQAARPLGEGIASFAEL